METKKLEFYECEGCGGSFTLNLMHHVEDDYSHTEGDYCDDCVAEMEARAEVQTDY